MATSGTEPRMETYACIVFEPAMPGEVLTPSGQVQQLFGPFSTEGQAEAWITHFREQCGGTSRNGVRWHFLILPLDDPRVMPVAPPRTDSSP